MMWAQQIIRKLFRVGYRASMGYSVDDLRMLEIIQRPGEGSIIFYPSQKDVLLDLAQRLTNAAQNDPHGWKGQADVFLLSLANHCQKLADAADGPDIT